jgi:hypothetical protein
LVGALAIGGEYPEGGRPPMNMGETTPKIQHMDNAKMS